MRQEKCVGVYAIRRDEIHRNVQCVQEARCENSEGCVWHTKISTGTPVDMLIETKT